MAEPTSTTATEAGEQMEFQAEVSRLLDIVANSLYSEREVFLRELISNASDACDRLRYLALTEPGLAEDGADYRITLAADKKAGILAVSDNGIGMSRDEMIDNLGTIARSGTAAFMGNLTEQQAGEQAGKAKSGEQKAGKTKSTTAKAKGGKEDRVSLIGQFGVGFYSAFMVASEVSVTTRRASETEGWRWTSAGRGEFTIAPEADLPRGTTVTLTLKKDAREYAEPDQLRGLVKTYSDHIPFPIVLGIADGGDEKGGSENDESKEGESKAVESLNQASAIWTRPRGEINENAHREFYHHVSHAMDDPWLTLHFRAEGVIEYAGLLYIPSQRPFDLFHPERRSQVKLYVRRVFITDDCEELLPSWLRFLRGVIDSQDLPLNVSRELLQNNPVLGRIRGGIVTRVLNALAKKAEKEPDDYENFWDTFGAVLKEGLYEDAKNRDKLLKLARFRSTAGDGLTSLADYAERMPKGQEAIYYVSGENADAVRRSPQLEGFLAKGIEVLLLVDPVDELWIPTVGVWKEKPFKSVTRGGTDLDAIEGKEDEAGDKKKSDTGPSEEVERLIALIKIELANTVKDVRSSDRLTDSPVCLVADEFDMDINMQRLLKQHQQLDEIMPRILEINPRHELIRRLAKQAAAEVVTAEAGTPEAGGGKPAGNDRLRDAAHLLLDQARILEGEPLPDPADHARRMTAMMTAALAAPS